ncbi:esterase-like activity of phytase family protein [cf. Phormidesmis sp. LEGE 11477]|uniref:esterase-like activity of phytase family protein n=1 Tax=cf. Phormidesmis sp. LEGE 11477 TaxID=1828680 RepID=UPI001883103B|nr:esterase-like activity of phytase family protein [cf. Phormidesmis sp. LEGE 11477]MBE9059483.1 esterase-like activity of phytase family protein [cf. Phormidesmis sp. LEGE 11477]
MVLTSLAGGFRLFRHSFICGLLILLLSGCAIPRVSAEDRLFLDISVDLVGSATLEKQTFDGEPVGGISAIAYDVTRDRLYALSDNRDRPRFYTLKIDSLSTLSTAADSQPTLADPLALSIEAVTYLTDAAGEPYPISTLDPEGMALTPTGTLLISTEGSPSRQVLPTVGEYDIATGQLKTAIPVPARYLPDSAESQSLGVQENLSFEALAINVSSGTGGVYEPYRLFVATEGPLLQDLDFEPDVPYKNRLIHYTISPYQTTLISEHLYEMDAVPTGAILHGLPEIAVLDQSGHFLGLERSYGLRGFVLKLFQLASGGATDISAIDSLKGDISGISPIRKQLVLDFADLDLPLQNYEAMTFGPTLRNRGNRQANPSRSLLVMSDDNFSDDQETSLLIFSLQQE